MERDIPKCFQESLLNDFCLLFTSLVFSNFPKRNIQYLYTVMHCLMTGTYSEKSIIKRFCRVIIIECT